MEVVSRSGSRRVYRNDLARRQGVAAEAISDAQITAHFTARNLAVQFVYDWQDASTRRSRSTRPPTTRWSTRLARSSRVSRMSSTCRAVYDAASLRENVYTGTFTEQGLLVAEMCYDSDFITLPVCSMGRVGAADLTCA